METQLVSLTFTYTHLYNICDMIPSCKLAILCNLYVFSSNLTPYLRFTIPVQSSTKCQHLKFDFNFLVHESLHNISLIALIVAIIQPLCPPKRLRGNIKPKLK